MGLIDSAFRWLGSVLVLAVLILVGSCTTEPILRTFGWETSYERVLKKRGMTAWQAMAVAENGMRYEEQVQFLQGAGMSESRAREVAYAGPGT